MRSVGRPRKYNPFLQILDDETLYIPATIVSAGEKAGLFLPGRGFFEEAPTEQELQQAKSRIRHTLGRLKLNQAFPEVGDGIVIIKGQPPFQAWRGKRWKATIK